MKQSLLAKNLDTQLRLRLENDAFEVENSNLYKWLMAKIFRKLIKTGIIMF